MEKELLIRQTDEHLNFLCNECADRRVGGEGNRQATLKVRDLFREAGWETGQTLLDVVDWQTQGASLTCNEQSFEVYSSLYSLGCKIEGELIAVEKVEELQNSRLTGKIVLLHGQIASEQIMPKNFVFYNPEEHQRLVEALEKAKPAALVCATGRNPAAAGGAYPYPLFEDGDFDLPSVYMKDTEGEKLLLLVGKTVQLNSMAERIPSTAYNVLARKSAPVKGRIVVTAHIDAKIGTPGAIDNATGVTTLLLLAGLLKDYKGPFELELLAFNGEDYYAVPGQMKYIEQHEGKFDDIILNINIDGAGFHIGKTCFSSFGLPPSVETAFREILQDHPCISEGLPWYQGDHSIFIQYGRPAIAVSSDWFIEHMEEQDITHTPKDNLSIVNSERVIEGALAIADLIRRLS